MDNENKEKIVTTMSIYNQCREVPKDAQKPIKGGRLKGMTDIKPMWRIEKLTEIFGACGLGWYTQTLKKEIIDGANNEKVAIVDILLFVNYKYPYGLDEDLWSIGIEGSGGSSFISKEQNGLYTSDECFKMAYTDALSVACKSLGFGADVYWGSNNTKYDSAKDEVETPPTIEEAKEYKLGFGKYSDNTLEEILDEDAQYLTEWYCKKNDKANPRVIKMIEMLTGEVIKPIDDEDLKITEEFNKVLVESETDLDELLKHYNKDGKENFGYGSLTKEQRIEAIKIMMAKIKKEKNTNGK